MYHKISNVHYVCTQKVSDINFLKIRLYMWFSECVIKSQNISLEAEIFGLQKPISELDNFLKCQSEMFNFDPFTVYQF